MSITDIYKESKFSQFIHGKFVGPSHEYQLVACTDDLTGNKPKLSSLVEDTYHFWGSQGTENDNQAVGICPNTTGILPHKDFLLIQAATAIDTNGQKLINGNRPFSQHRVIFLEQSDITRFKNCIGLLLLNFLEEPIPYFTQAPYNNEWSKIAPKVFQVRNNKGYAEYEEFFWAHHLPLIQALSVFLNKKRLLITDDDPDIPAVKFLDNILCWVPVSYRRDLGIAIGSIDERYCKWGNLIAKLDGLPRGELSSNLAWLELRRKQFHPHQGEHTEHVYVRNYIVIPTIENKWGKPFDILTYLDQDQPKEQSFHPDHPPDHFILNYPIEHKYKDRFLNKTLFQSKEFQTFLSSLARETFIDFFDNLWKVSLNKMRKDKLLEPVITFFEKTICFLPEKVTSIVDQLLDEPVESRIDLLNDNLISAFSQSQDEAVLEAIRKLCHKTIQEKAAYHDYQATKRIVFIWINHKEIFPAKDCFLLLCALLAAGPSYEEFSDLFVGEISLLLPYIDIDSPEKSSLFTYLSKDTRLANLFSPIHLLLKRQKSSLPCLSEIANLTSMNESEANRFYLAHIEAWKLSFHDSIPILRSAIEQSVTETLSFKVAPFWGVYEYFDDQNSSLIPALNKLSQGQQSNYWSNWRNLAVILYENSEKKQAIFLDEIVGRSLPFLDRSLAGHHRCHLLKIWLDALNKSFEKSFKESELEEFHHSNTWKYIDITAIKNCQSSLVENFGPYVEELIYWADIEQRQELISEGLINCLEIVLAKSKSISQKLWSILSSPKMVNSSESHYWQTLLSIKWTIVSMPALVLPKAEHLFPSNKQDYLYPKFEEIVSKLDKPELVDDLLKEGQFFGLNPLKLLGKVNPDACNSHLISIASKYVDQAKEIDNTYIPDHLKTFSKIILSSDGSSSQKDKLHMLDLFLENLHLILSKTPTYSQVPITIVWIVIDFCRKLILK